MERWRLRKRDENAQFLESENGNFVLYNDVEKEIKQLREALQNYCERLDPITYYDCIKKKIEKGRCFYFDNKLCKGE